MFQKDMKISLLLDFYGDVLSERRREIMEMYYNEDLSLAEIAEITSISRQGVRDSVKKSEQELISLEETLGLAKRFDNIKREIVSITKQIEELSKGADDNTKAAITKIEEALANLDV